MVKISCVMPFYNASSYMKHSLESVVHQEFDSFEIIAVNDGSLDNTLELLEEYQSKYPKKIRVFSQLNQGPSVARNLGIQKSSGEYILFFDDDDILYPNALSKMYKKASENQLDLLIFDHDRILLNGKKKYKTRKLNPNKIYTQSNLSEVLERVKISNTKLYKKSTIDSYNLGFEPNIIYEDIAFCLSFIAISKKIGYIKSPLFGYQQRINSITHQSINIGDLVKSNQALIRFIKDNNLESYYLPILLRCFKSLIGGLHKSGFSKSDFLTIRKFFQVYNLTHYKKSIKLRHYIKYWLILNNYYLLYKYLVKI